MNSSIAKQALPDHMGFPALSEAADARGTLGQVLTMTAKVRGKALDSGKFVRNENIINIRAVEFILHV